MQINTDTHDIDLASLALRGDALFGELNQLREHDPLFWSETSLSWIVTGHAELMEALSGALPLSSVYFPEALYRVLPKEELEKRIPHGIEFMRWNVPNMDGADHMRLRKLFMKALNRKLVESQRPFVRERVNQLLDIAQTRGELEFNEEISRQLPGTVILRLLGMHTDNLARLKKWAVGIDGATGTFDPLPEWLDEYEVVINEMREVFSTEIEKRQNNPQEDLISQFVTVMEQGAGLSREEMLSALILVVVGGHDSTSNTLTLGLRALANNADAWAFWRAHPERSVDNAIELMRYIAMSSMLTRYAAEEFEWRGRQIRKGDQVKIMIAGGNRDPNVFTDPERLDLARTNNDVSLTFSPGLHHCVGHLLAKLQVAEFFTALVQRFDRVEVLEDPSFLPMLVFRNVTELKVRFHPRTG